MKFFKGNGVICSMLKGIHHFSTFRRGSKVEMSADGVTQLRCGIFQINFSPWWKFRLKLSSFLLSSIRIWNSKKSFFSTITLNSSKSCSLFEGSHYAYRWLSFQLLLFMRNTFRKTRTFSFTTILTSKFRHIKKCTFFGAFATKSTSNLKGEKRKKSSSNKWIFLGRALAIKGGFVQSGIDHSGDRRGFLKIYHPKPR